MKRRTTSFRRGMHSPCKPAAVSVVRDEQAVIVSRSSLLRLLVILGIIGVAAVGLTACGSGEEAAPRPDVATEESAAEPAEAPAPSAESAGAPERSAESAGDLRAVIVFDGAAAPSQVDGPLQVELVWGDLPQPQAVATVLTDEDCAPDAAGISHCLNRLRLADGSELAVRHNHDMGKVPCLFPGEPIVLQARA